jgi:hypothetical protein
MNENKYYVYVWKIKNTNEVFYIGKGCGDRYKSLRSRNKFFLDMYNSHDCYVQIAYRNLDEETAYRIEYLLVQYFKDKGRLTNQTDGGDGTRGFKMPLEVIEKIKSTLRKKYTPELKKAISDERKQPNSIYQSELFKLKSTNNGNWSGSNNPNYGHRWSEEMKNNLRNKQIESKRYIGSKNPNHKRIKCIETNEFFDCVQDAQAKYNVKNQSSFSWALKYPTRTAAGLHWVQVS